MATACALFVRSAVIVQIVILPWMPRPCARADGLEEVSDFVRSVLAVADRTELGLPDNLSIDVSRYGPVVDGQLPPDMQRYLERLVSVSSAADQQTLVTMLWDDSLIVDEDQEPHSIFDQYQGNSYERAKRNGGGRRKMWFK